MSATRPDWLKVRFSSGPNYQQVKSLLRGMTLHTVCEEAQCPNIGECFESRTATFLILGRVCTRNCRFCAVEPGRPEGLDEEEPERVAKAVADLGLRYVVVTSVTRDDLPDGGAGIFAATIRRVRTAEPGCGIEVLIPDFLGSEEALATVVKARPDILNHNIETVPRLYRRARPQANYERSLTVLRHVKEIDPSVLGKSGIMVGLGETWDELSATMGDLVAVGCDILTIGQYLSPSPQHLPIERYYTPEEFRRLKEEGERLGLRHVESAPLVRSSYHAGRQAEELAYAGPEEGN
ncbi:MAG: lipoyl synthase [Dehalococcoidales bacterium]|nr:lipoyl synthase [Dehalococcoidales bacterium]